MKIIIPNEAPKKSGKALTEAVELIGAQLNEIADKYGVTVSVVAYKEDKQEKKRYVSVSDGKILVNCFAYHTGKYATDEQKADVLTLERK